MVPATRTWAGTGGSGEFERRDPRADADELEAVVRFARDVVLFRRNADASGENEAGAAAIDLDAGEVEATRALVDLRLDLATAIHKIAVAECNDGVLEAHDCIELALDAVHARTGQCQLEPTGNGRSALRCVAIRLVGRFGRWDGNVEGERIGPRIGRARMHLSGEAEAAPGERPLAFEPNPAIGLARKPAARDVQRSGIVRPTEAHVEIAYIERTGTSRRGRPRQPIDPVEDELGNSVGVDKTVGVGDLLDEPVPGATLQQGRVEARIRYPRAAEFEPARQQRDETDAEPDRARPEQRLSRLLVGDRHITHPERDQPGAVERQSRGADRGVHRPAERPRDGLLGRRPQPVAAEPSRAGDIERADRQRQNDAAGHQAQQHDPANPPQAAPGGGPRSQTRSAGRRKGVEPKELLAAKLDLLMFGNVLFHAGFRQ